MTHQPNVEPNKDITQGLPFIERRTTVFADIARANPKSQSCQ